ncbi:UNVERIFIED_ORG: hypothetical protein J2Y77_002673 [Pseudomonas lini]
MSGCGDIVISTNRWTRRAISQVQMLRPRGRKRESNE